MKISISGTLRAAIVLLLAVFSLTIAVSAKDDWVQVRSKNFFLIGNASEKDIRKVGTRLEQFRETFRQLLTKMSFTAPIPTNVIVFKNDSAYKPFKPKRADGKLDTFVAGFFQPGEDVNYITLSAEGEDAQTFSTIFHEYVHFMINTNFGKSKVPAWFNEGLAEYYETFQIENDQVAKLGLPQENHLRLLQQNKLMPLDQLFNVSNFQLLQTGNHSRSIFYAESWALIHYLIAGGRSAALNSFLGLVLKDVPPEKAFREAFQMDYADMESALRKYVQQSTYKYVSVTFKNKLTFDSDMRSAPLDEAETNAYLGDLLYHTNRVEDAEPFLLTALRSRPELSLANTALGMVLVREKKYDEAKPILEKAISGDQQNHRALYEYAYLLSLEARNGIGRVTAFDPSTTAKIRDALNRAISLRPDFTESYELLAFINLVNDQQLDESVALMRKALQYQPGNQRYAMRIAEILFRQKKLDEAAAMAANLSATADDEGIKRRADELVGNIRELRDFETRQKQFEATGAAGPQQARERTDDELNREAEFEQLRTINRALRPTGPSETRILGHMQKIDCTRGIVYTLNTDAGPLLLTSKDFAGLTLNTFAADAGDVAVGCDADISKFLALFTYKQKPAGTGNVRGDLVAIEFVPQDFRILTDEEMKRSFAVVPDAPVAKDQQEAIIRSIRKALLQPKEGEKREIGFLEKIDCVESGGYFDFKTTSRTLRLFSSSLTGMPIRLFTRDLEGMQFGCRMNPIDVPVVFIYQENSDPKLKADGKLVSLDFVPRDFRLD